MNTLEMDKIIREFQDDDELSVGYQRTYNSVRDWLIRPVDKKGCGFDSVFVDRLFPVVCDRIKRNELQFGPNQGRVFDMHMRDICRTYEHDVLKASAAVREQLFQKEYQRQQKEGLVLLKDLTDQNNSLRRAVTWLLIITGLALTVTTLVLTPAVNYLHL